MWTLRIGAHQPHIASIEENSSVERTKQMGTKLSIRLEFEISSLVDVGIVGVGSTVSTRSDGAHAKGTNAVGTTSIEEFTEGSAGAVAVGIDRSNKSAGGKGVAIGDCGGCSAFRQWL